MPPFTDQQIIDAWGQNAAPWIKTVREQQIESRRLVTDQAVVDAVMASEPATVLDIGCGEGWLARSLTAQGAAVSGVDVVPALVEEAAKHCTGEFRVAAYEDLASTAWGQQFDGAVCNFSLIGKECVEHVFKTVPDLLTPDGRFIVQTLHPAAACGQHAYEDGWREGSWAGFCDEFRDPAPWYFRTTESWLNLFRDFGYDLVQFREPVHPETKAVMSLVMAGQPKR